MTDSTEGIISQTNTVDADRRVVQGRKFAIEIARLTGTAVAVADLDLAFGGIAAALDVLPQTGLREWLSEHATRPNAPLARHLTDHHSGLRVLAAPQEPQVGVPFEPSDVADLVEYHGSEQIVHLKLRLDDPTQGVTLRLGARDARLSKGDRVGLQIGSDSFHLFHADGKAFARQGALQ